MTHASCVCWRSLLGASGRRRRAQRPSPPPHVDRDLGHRASLSTRFVGSGVRAIASVTSGQEVEAPARASGRPEEIELVRAPLGVTLQEQAGAACTLSGLGETPRHSRDGSPAMWIAFTANFCFPFAPSECPPHPPCLPT